MKIWHLIVFSAVGSLVSIAGAFGLIWLLIKMLQAMGVL